MSDFAMGFLAVVAVALAVVGYRFYATPRFRCPFCMERLPWNAKSQVRRKPGQEPYTCPFCDHVILPMNLTTPAKR